MLPKSWSSSLRLALDGLPDNCRSPVSAPDRQRPLVRFSTGRLAAVARRSLTDRLLPVTTVCFPELARSRQTRRASAAGRTPLKSTRPRAPDRGKTSMWHELPSTSCQNPPCPAADHRRRPIGNPSSTEVTIGIQHSAAVAAVREHENVVGCPEHSPERGPLSPSHLALRRHQGCQLCVLPGK